MVAHGEREYVGGHVADVAYILIALAFFVLAVAYARIAPRL